MVNDVTQIAPTSSAPTMAAGSSTAFGATHAAPSAIGLGFAAPISAARTTVLPKVDGDGTRVELSLESRSRYEPTKLLGAGGMGEVVLVRDHDIERKVAVKRLLPEMTEPSILARFVDEIRTVGRLEHPNIVPIHDVGVDELGRYFFVMKYVEGETLESIIEKLTAGDPAYVAKYSIEVRIELFLGILHALEYAHAQGIVHRDIKPANVMIGRYGEVVLMDWGIARPIAATRDAATTAEGEIKGDGERARMYATRVGSLVGTPAYMSPEQARGDNAAVDARSDLYSAMVLFHELIGLRHYLRECETMDALLAGVISRPFAFFDIVGLKYARGQALPPELVHVFVKGFAKDPAARFQSAGELIAALHGILEGSCQVQCHLTFTKRIYRELGRLTDRAPFLAFFVLIGILGAVAFTGVQLVRMLIA
ncbi:Serine/threonine protein kinase PrkC, regulator of stationary phase [Minicystis rosea]|nr:Serine/threonine protein kinase PrkC, regulator of stationary phase [Minicystis rosea]